MEQLRRSRGLSPLQILHRPKSGLYSERPERKKEGEQRDRETERGYQCFIFNTRTLSLPLSPSSLTLSARKSFALEAMMAVALWPLLCREKLEKSESAQFINK